MKEEYMREAIIEAQAAALLDEVPVGAVVVKDGVIIARAHNEKESRQNPIFHAELLALSRACEYMKNWYLDGCELYVTLEPCAMCAGAMLNTRIRALYYGAREPKSGCVESLYQLLSDRRFNHTVAAEGGILEEECASLLSEFFRKKRGRT